MRLLSTPIFTLVAILCIALSGLLFSGCNTANTASASAPAAVIRSKTRPIQATYQTETVRTIQHASIESVEALRAVDKISLVAGQQCPKVYFAELYVPPDYGPNLLTKRPDLTMHNGLDLVGTRAREKV